MSMKKLLSKKEYLVIAAVILLFAFVSITSTSSIRLLQGNARVVNYMGIVRGATQKLVKEEIMGWYLLSTDAPSQGTSDWYPNDALIARLDSIVDELLSGEGPNGLVVLQDEVYLSNLRLVQAHWTRLKELIAQVRAGADPSELFASSQEYFTLANETVFSAELYSEAQVQRINVTLILVNSIFILLIVFGLILYWRSRISKRRADALGEIAYVDPLTRLENRASCERAIERLTAEPGDADIAVLMFDMNDLKLTNDSLGHQSGDKIITAFGTILKESAKSFGFVGRFGGDEFLAIFEPGDEPGAQAFLDEVRERVEAFNQGKANSLERIHYAVGYAVANPRIQDIEDIIHEADNQMYSEKRKAKGRTVGG